MSASITLNRRAIVIASALAIIVFFVVSQSWHPTVYRSFPGYATHSTIPSWDDNHPSPPTTTAPTAEPSPDAGPIEDDYISLVTHGTSASIPLSTASIASSEVHASLSTPVVQQEPWMFDAERDRNDHSLTQEQCDQAFPDLYFEIERSQAYWKNRQGDAKLTEEQWGLEWSQDGGLRVMIYDQQLYIVESRGLNHFLHWKERSHATLHNLHRAVQSALEPIPNIEFSIKIDDNIRLTDAHPNVTVWNFNRNASDASMEQCWLIPDFNFWAYPRVAGAYGDFQREVIDHADDFNAKIPELVWRGTIAFNPGIREKLLTASEGQSWSAVHRVAEDVDDEDAAKWHITLPDHCRYKYAVHTEGTTWSGRLKYLLSCHQTVLIHPLTFTTHLYHLLQGSGPNQNYVPVSIDFTDLPKTMEDLLADNYKASMIADNAARIFRDQYFTPAAQTCYFRKLFQVWSDMTHAPDPYSYAHHSDGSIESVFRGVTYEEYIFMDTSYPPE